MDPGTGDSTLFPYTTLFRSVSTTQEQSVARAEKLAPVHSASSAEADTPVARHQPSPVDAERSEEHTSELQSPGHLVCRLLLEKKKKAPGKMVCQHRHRCQTQ